MSPVSEDIIKCILLNEKFHIVLQISDGPIDGISTLVSVVYWHRIGDKIIPEPTSMSEMNVVGRAQLTFQMLALFVK